MTFVSTEFLAFIAVTTILYYLVGHKYQWLVLLFASLFFYYSNSKWLLLVNTATGLITYIIGRLIENNNLKGKNLLESHDDFTAQEKKKVKEKTKRGSRRILTCGIVIVLGILVFLKYHNFFAGNANKILKVFGVKIPKHSLLLPIGISFYTLQALAYMIDVYRGKIAADRNPLKFMLFMSYFPQIVQGPIARYNQLADQLYQGHSFDYDRICKGMQLMMWGFVQKSMIADRLAIPVNQVFYHYRDYHGGIVFLSVLLYGLQVYTDFSGGMDIARGFSQMIGIEMDMNFRQPYFARSVEEFWRRWHITLGSWMRDYVFYPLSISKPFAKMGKITRKLFGSRVGSRIPPFISMFIVYTLVGFWHGAEWKFVAYGFWNGMFIMMGILLEDKYNLFRDKLKIDKDSYGWIVFQTVRTFIIVGFGRFFSRARGLRAALFMIRAVFVDFSDLSFITDGSLVELGLSNANWILLIFLLEILFIVDYLHYKDVHIRETIAKQHVIFRWTLYFAVIIAILVFGMYGPGYNASSFLYEQF